MKKILSLFSLLFMMVNLSAQEPVRMSYDEALKLAEETGKTVVIHFSGSDWCAPCIRLENEILDTPEFKDFAKDFVWVKADFPRKKSNALSKEVTAENDKLAERFNTKGYFPLLVFLDKEQEVKATLGYKAVTVAEYIDILKKMLE